MVHTFWLKGVERGSEQGYKEKKSRLFMDLVLGVQFDRFKKKGAFFGFLKKADFSFF